jgi:hypothetical protein
MLLVVDALGLSVSSGLLCKGLLVRFLKFFQKNKAQICHPEDCAAGKENDKNNIVLHCKQNQ